jgi:Nif-specific regulatory protein
MFFLRKFSVETKKHFINFSQQALEALYSYFWPGNVRELENTIERACVLGTPPAINVSDLRLNTKKSPEDNFVTIAEDDEDKTLKTAINKFKKSYVTKILEQTSWNQTEAGKILGIQRTYVSRLINELGIK